MAIIFDKYLADKSKKYVAVISDKYVAVISDIYVAFIYDGRWPQKLCDEKGFY